MTAEKVYRIYNTFRLVAILAIVTALVCFCNKPVNESSNSAGIEASEVTATEQVSK